MSEVFYEREQAIFRKLEGHPLELFSNGDGKFYPYTGDCYRVMDGGPYGGADRITLEEARKYMDVAPVDYPEAKKAASGRFLH